MHIELHDTVNIHQALADATRVRIIRLLLERELCVCEIVKALDEPQYKISRHLTVLKHAGLVRDRREGTWMHYDIAPTLAREWVQALQALSVAWDRSPDVAEALQRLRQQATRPTGASVGSN